MSEPVKWNEQGCAQCRGAWESGDRSALAFVGVSYALHTRLYHCRACKSFWEELGRYAHEISSEEAEALQRDASFENHA